MSRILPLVIHQFLQAPATNGEPTERLLDYRKLLLLLILTIQEGYHDQEECRYLSAILDGPPDEHQEGVQTTQQIPRLQE